MKSIKPLLLFVLSTVLLTQAFQNQDSPVIDLQYDSGVDQETTAVFITPDRIKMIKERIENQYEPAYSAFQKLISREQELLTYEPLVPETWYVPPFIEEQITEVEDEVQRGTDYISYFEILNQR